MDTNKQKGKQSNRKQEIKENIQNDNKGQRTQNGKKHTKIENKRAERERNIMQKNTKRYKAKIEEATTNVQEITKHKHNINNKYGEYTKEDKQEK